MQSFDDLEKKIKDIDDTIAALQRARDILKKPEETEDQEEKDNKETEDQEERAFANYIRGIISEERASNLTSGDNGAVIPTSIANKIIKKVYEICPIYQLATRYDVGGTLSIPYYNEETTAITPVERLHDERERLVLARDIGGKAALVPHRGGEALFLEQFFEPVVDPAAPFQRLGEGLRAAGDDHKLLHIQAVGRVDAAV